MPSGPVSGSEESRCSLQKEARGMVRLGFGGLAVLVRAGWRESTSLALMKDVGFWRVEPLWLALMKRAEESVVVIQFWSLGERMIATTRS